MVKKDNRTLKIAGLVMLAISIACIVIIISTDNEKITKNPTNTKNDNIIESPKLDEISEEQRKKDDATEKFLDDIGVEKDNPVKTDSGATLVGNAAKTVKNFKTLAEAEEDMGYYLGLHNSIKCNPDYSLVGVYNIGKEWYQALYEDVNSVKPSITLKVSSNTSEEDLIKPYKEAGYTERSDDTISGVSVTVEGKEDKVNLVHFTINNGRAYSLYSVTALEKVDMEKIVTELIENLKTMDDWVD